MEQAYKIGIIGCGHLGQALAQACLNNGIPKDRLLLSYRGSAETRGRLAEKGLLDCAVPNERLLSQADVIFITIKPQDFATLKDIGIPAKTTVVSLMAGIPLELLREVVGKNALRMMISGPDAILSGHGVAVVYPGNAFVEQFLKVIRVRQLQLSGEDELNVFTAGVCIPPALLQLDDPAKSAEAIKRLSGDYPMMATLYEWSLGVLPQSLTGEEKEVYIKRMATKGGITEAVINSLKAGAPLDTALKNGVARAEEISKSTLEAFKK
ncbi:pyrroline-5-carboxylate reductase [Sporobacter termitidis DSM 10068]|uniref:Pyrroline-5-carboxylate reductase n=1 Tax=Sporobacter termitidis DSM 10068 TaxID=1123282 RepID=A0A1M5Y5Z3_9FIRM|nr:NAD(P)-binding domain-containing protein [Sporobacter termitidis]SHI07234.1 pyrroline-5-carboxylate reductase [Sporobacter termitidis DSM 10068]